MTQRKTAGITCLIELRLQKRPKQCRENGHYSQKDGPSFNHGVQGGPAMALLICNQKKSQGDDERSKANVSALLILLIATRPHERNSCSRPSEPSPSDPKPKSGARADLLVWTKNKTREQNLSSYSSSQWSTSCGPRSGGVDLFLQNPQQDHFT
jgi:hypothetical protein